MDEKDEEEGNYEEKGNTICLSTVNRVISSVENHITTTQGTSKYTHTHRHTPPPPPTHTHTHTHTHN
jgi:hypothetical protein